MMYVIHKLGIFQTYRISEWNYAHGSRFLELLCGIVSSDYNEYFSYGWYLLGIRNIATLIYG